MSSVSASTLASALLLAASFALLAAARNRVARGKLRLAQIALAVGLAIATLIAYPVAGFPVPPALHVVPGLALSLGLIAVAVAVLLNPLFEDRPAQRFPNIVQDAIIVLAFYLVATFVFRDSGIVAASAVSAIVVGFALQDTLGNAFAGLAIQVEKPFRVGNWIRIQGHEGRVDEITWRATKLRTRAGTFVVVPNSIISKEPITNFNEPVLPVRLSVDIGATYLKTPDQVKAAVRDAFAQMPLALASPAPVALVHDFAGSSIVYRVHFWIADYEAEESALDQARTALFYGFARHGIEIPYPIQVEHSREEPAPSPSRQEMEAAIGGVALFAALSPDERARLAAGASPRLFGPGETIVRQGEEGGTLFIVQRGEVRVFLDAANQEVARLRPLDVLGEMSLLTGEPRTANATAVTDCMLVEIGAAVFREVILNNPAAIEAMSFLVVERRAGLDRARADAEEHRAALRAQSRPLLERIRVFLRLPS